MLRVILKKKACILSLVLILSFLLTATAAMAKRISTSTSSFSTEALLLTEALPEMPPGAKWAMIDAEMGGTIDVAPGVTFRVKGKALLEDTIIWACMSVITVSDLEFVFGPHGTEFRHTINDQERPAQLNMSWQAIADALGIDPRLALIETIIDDRITLDEDLLEILPLIEDEYVKPFIESLKVNIEAEIKVCQYEIEACKDNIEAYKDNIEAYTKIHVLEDEIQVREDKIQALPEDAEDDILHLEHEIADREAKIVVEKNKILGPVSDIPDREAKIANEEDKILDEKNEILDLEDEILDLKYQFEYTESYTKRLKECADKLEEVINKLNERIKKLQECRIQDTPEEFIVKLQESGDFIQKAQELIQRFQDFAGLDYPSEFEYPAEFYPENFGPAEFFEKVICDLELTIDDLSQGLLGDLYLSEQGGEYIASYLVSGYTVTWEIPHFSIYYYRRR